MSTPEQYDALIVGAGQGGDPLARAYAAAGKRVAIIERDKVGGTCVNYGCTPTKTMASNAHVADTARRAGEYGVHVGAISVDMTSVRARKRGIVKEFHDGTEKRLKSTEGIDLIYGSARFTGPKTLVVDLNGGGSRALSSDVIVLNLGCRPSVLKIAGIEAVPYLDSTSIQELDAVPGHLLIIGGGYISVEFGQMFRRFGSDVTILQRGKQLLTNEDADVAEEVAKILQEDGITILLNTETKRVAKDGDAVSLTVLVDGTERTLTGTHLLAGAGRTPNSDGIDLSAAGIETDDHGFIKCNDTLETNVPGVFVVGDIKGGPQFTHISYDDFRILKANLLDGGKRTVSDRPVPYTVFMDPQVAHVGLQEHEAKARGLDYKVVKLNVSDTARGEETGETRGFLKATVDMGTKQILGATIICLDGGEIMAILEVAMMGKLPYTALRDGVFAHPTMAESLNNLFMQLD